MAKGDKICDYFKRITKKKKEKNEKWKFIKLIDRIKLVYKIALFYEFERNLKIQD